MTYRERAVAALATALGALVVTLAPAAACPVCFGDPNAPMTRSAETGVWFLLTVILLVEAAFGIFFFVYLRRRARNLRDPLPCQALRLVKKGA